MQGKVLSLFITKDDTNKTRLKVQSASVDANGIIEDKFYKKDPMRAILITSQESYTLTSENGIALEEGSLGENILIDINPYNLTSGDQFSIGDTTFEITQNCTLCKGLSTVDKRLPKLLKNDRGIFAKVISGKSEIHLGDNVEISTY